ncbi:MAG: hypothetical protein LBS76_02175, partial [Mycoplasmataceae bacterium]|nr:hypothetical protein [Mycoplasmataceae bacterium]
MRRKIRLLKNIGKIVVHSTMVFSASTNISYIIDDVLDREDIIRRKKTNSSISVRTSPEYDAGVVTYPNMRTFFTIFSWFPFDLYDLKAQIYFETNDSNYLSIDLDEKVSFLALVDNYYIDNVKLLLSGQYSFDDSSNANFNQTISMTDMRQSSFVFSVPTFQGVTNSNFTISSNNNQSLLSNIYLDSSRVGNELLQLVFSGDIQPHMNDHTRLGDLPLTAGEFPTIFNLRSIFKNASYYVGDLFDVPVTNLNPNLLITVDEQNSYLTAKPGVDNTFTSHF